MYFVVRWVAVDHAPVSNMYEFMTFFGIMLTGSYLIIHFLYKQIVVGLFTIPVSLIILGYGSVFAKEVSPLVPSLQSHWLTIHVMTVAFSSAILSVSFATGLIYLLRTLDVSKNLSVHTVLSLCCIVWWLSLALLAYRRFSALPQKRCRYNSIMHRTARKATYSMMPLIVSKGAVTENGEAIGGVEITNKIDAKKLNSIVWAFIVGTILYGVIRFITRKSVSALLKPWTSRVQPQLMDEISYRAVVIGFPLFALGGLLFAMIWAQIAWSRYWGWDPKEVWALITFYSTRLPPFSLIQRLGRRKTAWLAIIGFGIIVFNQVFVNLVIAGLHSMPS